MEEACQEPLPVNRTPASSGRVIHEPIVVITQGNNQPYIVQSVGNMNGQNEQFLQQPVMQPILIHKQYQVYKEEAMDSMQVEV